MISATPSSKTDLSSWHSRLGHPSFTVLKSVVSRNSLHVSKSSPKQFHYSDYFINISQKLPFNSTPLSLDNLLNISTAMCGCHNSPQLMITNIIWWLLITLQDTHGCILSRRNHKLRRSLWHLHPWLKIDSVHASGLSTLTMAVSSLDFVTSWHLKAYRIWLHHHIRQSTTVSLQEISTLVASKMCYHIVFVAFLRTPWQPQL